MAAVGNSHDITSWMRRHRVAIAIAMLVMLLGPALFFGVAALWFSAVAKPGFAIAALLCALLLVLRVRRNRRAADDLPSGSIRPPDPQVER